MASDAHATLSVQQLAAWSIDPQLLDLRCTHRLGPFSVQVPDAFDPDAIGRWHTVVAYQGEWALYVDRFRAEEKTSIDLTLEGATTYAGALRRHVKDADGMHGLHVLGDYLITEQTDALQLGMT